MKMTLSCYPLKISIKIYGLKKVLLKINQQQVHNPFIHHSIIIKLGNKREVNKVRKLDFIISFIIAFSLLFINLIDINTGIIIACMIAALFVSLVLGTITNLISLIFKKLKE